MAETGRMSPEYHAAHLAFSRTEIVEAAAKGRPILDRLKTYTDDVTEAGTARCQHCPCLADERSFMCSDCASEADFEVQTLRDQLEGAVGALRHILESAEHPSLTVRSTEYIAKVAGDALAALALPSSHVPKENHDV